MCPASQTTNETLAGFGFQAGKKENAEFEFSSKGRSSARQTCLFFSHQMGLFFQGCTWLSIPESANGNERAAAIPAPSCQPVRKKCRSLYDLYPQKWGGGLEQPVLERFFEDGCGFRKIPTINLEFLPKGICKWGALTMWVGSGAMV